MADLTNDVLSHLQFQDRMAQVLAEANANLTQIRDISRELLSRAESEDLDDVVRDIRSRFGVATIRLSGESELASSEAELHAGVVLTF